MKRWERILWNLAGVATCLLAFWTSHRHLHPLTETLTLAAFLPLVVKRFAR